MVIAPDGRVFVCLQGGQLRVIKNGTLLETPFLSVAVDSNGERGLLGVAFDPDFTTNQYVYVYYTALNPSHNRVARFTANGDVAVAGSEALILRLPDLTTATSHNAGAIHFGVDGKLYVAVGDNGDAASAQSLDNPLGKLLRIDKDGGIPSDNPFVTTAQGQNRAIWALGLRNPFTFAVQPGTGLVFINDVGAAKWEEINRGLAGANYGWPTCEGACATPGFTNPIFAYRHGSSSTRGCAITGGAFYNAATEPFPTEFVGQYFFADYCSGWIRRLDPSTAKATDFAAGIVSPVDLRVGDDGALYYLTRYDGSVWKVTYPGSQTPPTFTLHPADQTVAIGQSATFSVSVEGPGPISYEWRRNDVAIPGATSPTYTTPPVQLSDHGDVFHCVATNSYGSSLSQMATLSVTSNTPPTGTITSPASGSLYSAGATITFAGTGVDAQDGTLPASAFTWRVDFHHDAHIHPFLPDTQGTTGGSFIVPTTGETSANVWYRIHLAVTDSEGLPHASFVDILPRTVTVTLAANFPGLELTLDGQPVQAAHSFVGVVGMIRSIGAPQTQSGPGGTYKFSSWSDGGAMTHQIATPETNTTYTATFTKQKRNGR